MNLSEKLSDQDKRLQTTLQENRRLLTENEKLQLTINELQGIIRGLQSNYMKLWIENERLKSGNLHDKRKSKLFSAGHRSR